MTTEAYICDGVRTPIGQYGGALSAIRPDDLVAIVLRALLSRASDIDPSAIDDVIIGCANQAGEDNRNVARMSALLAGLPVTVPGVTVNRLCASGLDAVASASRLVRSGDGHLVIAGGVESMSRAPLVLPKPDNAFSRRAEIFDTTIGWRFINPDMHFRYGTDSMPETAENVAREFGISREDQDNFALRSQKRAANALASGRLAREIVAVQVPNGKKQSKEFVVDEHPRADTTIEKLNALRPIIAETGTVTAGNSSGVNDGAAALLIASDQAANHHSLVPVARIVGATSVGVSPRIMGIGPVDAVRTLLNKCKVSMEDIGVIELNEAFASQALAVLRGLGIDDDDERVNPNGGAIALGHPLGMSGARLALTAASELNIRGERYALCTMCVGVGQGVAMLLERA
jgi:3-oxoadipyl-CoA thiolase